MSSTAMTRAFVRRDLKRVRNTSDDPRVGHVCGGRGMTQRARIKQGKASLIGGIAVGIAVLVLWVAIAHELAADGVVDHGRWRAGGVWRCGLDQAC